MTPSVSFSKSFICDALLTDDLTYTLNSIEKMRSKSGLLNDTIWISNPKSGQIRTLISATSPSNIAVDLLVQSEAGNKSNLNRTLKTLSQIEIHKDSGLFFSWYSTESSAAMVKSYDVSSIDNLHLALALWTIARKFPGSTFAHRAQSIFERMDFSVFYDSSTGLVGGNLKRKDGIWIREAYNFSHLGSEARILYSLGWALDLFKSIPKDSDFLNRAISNLIVEKSSWQEGEILKLWDGALFQLYFPKIFIAEERYSTQFKTYFKTTAKLIAAEGKRRGLLVPAAHSPGRRSYQGVYSYKDKSGLKILVSEKNKDLHLREFKEDWEELFTPYSLYMAATSGEGELLEAMARLRNFKAKRGLPLYLEEYGFLDGLLVEGPRAYTVVPAQLALNQNMIALSIFIMNAKDGLSLSARTLAEDPKVSARLKLFYQKLDRRLSYEN